MSSSPSPAQATGVALAPLERLGFALLFGLLCAIGIAVATDSSTPVEVFAGASVLAHVGLHRQRHYLVLLIPGGLLLAYPEFHMFSAIFTTAGALQAVARG